MESQLSVKILSVYQLSFNLSFVGYVDVNNLLEGNLHSDKKFPSNHTKQFEESNFFEVLTNKARVP